MRITAYAGTDVGQVREVNEDNYFPGTSVFAVADGMGGHVAGEVASREALKPLESLDGQTFGNPEDATAALRKAIETANREVVARGQADPDLEGMGTTLTAVLVRDDRLHLAHVGDSRAYLFRDGRLSQLTTDHTLVEQLVQEGRLSRDEIATHPQRSVITRAIGVDTDVTVDTLPPQALQPGDQVLLCSDGLTGPVGEAEIADILTETTDGDAAVRALLDAANQRGGPDNITVVMLRVSSDEAGADGQSATAAKATSPVTTAIPIRTGERVESSDWAADMGRLADRQGAERGVGPLPRVGRGRRILGVLTGIAVLLAVLGVGGWLVLSRAFFIGELDGRVAVYNGLPEEMAGIRLYRLMEATDVPVAELSPLTRQRIADGITVSSLEEARETVGEYQSDIEDNPAPTEAPTTNAGRPAAPRPRAVPVSAQTRSRRSSPPTRRANEAGQ
ncbi:MAG: Stp1/IreP family PP2C-type Ser/Thr phosphatase [Egibacteraceae bacterium]